MVKFALDLASGLVLEFISHWIVHRVEDQPNGPPAKSLASFSKTDMQTDGLDAIQRYAQDEWVYVTHSWHSFCLFKLLLIGSALTSLILSIIPQHPSTGVPSLYTFHPPASISLPNTRPQARNEQRSDLWVQS